MAVSPKNNYPDDYIDVSKNGAVVSNAQSIHHIGDYILVRRQESGFSQEQLVDSLIKLDPVFAEIDAMTISRWERKKVIPNLNRQIALFRYFGDQPHSYLYRADFEIGQLPALGRVQKTLANSLGYIHSLGVHPYMPQNLTELTVRDLNESDLPDLSHYICNYMDHLTQGEVGWTPEWLISLLSHPATIGSTYWSEGLLIGHILMIRMKRDKHLEVLSEQLDDVALTPSDLIELDQPGDYYILDGYLGHHQILQTNYRDLIRWVINDPGCAALGFKARTEIGKRVMTLCESTICGRGEQVYQPFWGVRERGQRYRSINYLLKRDDMLLSPAAINLMRGSLEE